jgi:1-acyl-sn-glycerol-3-phosphate acyltransferase
LITDDAVYYITKWLSNCFCYAVLLMRVTGKENIPKTGGFIIASNHVSYLDPVAVGVACPRRVSYMARHSLFKYRISAWYLRCLGVFPVKRGSADSSALKEGVRRVRGGKGLLLFPEGTRQPGGKLGVGEPGAGFLAVQSGAPVIPVFVSGTEKALPRGAKFFKPTVVTVRFGKQIFIERRMPYEAVASEIMENIRHLSCN